MNKKFLSAILFGALMVTSTGTFVSCKDYDDDIDQINTELAGLKDQIAALQSKINSGEWVSGVTNTADGVTITLGNAKHSTLRTVRTVLLVQLVQPVLPVKTVRLLRLL